MKAIDVVALVVTLSGCGALSEQRFLDENARLLGQQQFLDENAKLQSRQAQQAQSLDELAAMSSKILEMQRRLECYVRLIDVKQTCDLLARDIGDPSTRNNAIYTCMTNRGFKQDC